MKSYFGYIRVSTAKQGAEGVSLQEQKSAIERHAARNNLTIQEWFEERQTAAKRGRPVFARMLTLLRRGKAAGVVMHKIDRSARNLKDWADLGELVDVGIEVQFAADAFDLSSRGGRLSADIQAVVAADYVRNLREETRKGFYGRLKQGVYPLPAPVGYLDTGKGNAKTIDPKSAPLVRDAFALYSSGNYSLRTLLPELHRRGLTNMRGGQWSVNGLANMLSNPFYCGLIRLKRSGETFAGAHAPLISVALHERVQRILRGKAVRKVQRHDFAFRRLLRCDLCGHDLTGERQKGHVYYRCHTKECPTATVREEVVEEALRTLYARVQLTEDETAKIRRYLYERQAVRETRDAERRASIELQLSDAKARMQRVTDALVDGLLDKTSFEERKRTLLFDIGRLEEALNEENEQNDDFIEKMFELAKSLVVSHEMANADERRRIAKITTSNLALSGKELVVTPSEPFLTLANRPSVTSGAPKRDRLRTGEICQEQKDWLKAFVDRLLEEERLVRTQCNGQENDGIYG